MEEKVKKVRVYSEEERARRREAERKRMEDPEYRAAKRAKDRLRMENKEVRDRKRALDKDRVKAPDVAARKLKISEKFRQTDKYKEWVSGRLASNLVKYRVGKIPYSIGKYCPILPVRCDCCGVVTVKKERLVGVSIVKSTHCDKCAKGKRIPRTVDVICVDCGNTCQGNRRRTLCDPCAKARAKERNRTHPSEIARKKSRGASLRSRARKRGAYVDTVNVRKVYERDKWRCVSCHCKVERTRYHQSNRATIDHKVPLSRGGSHTYENCQTMCVMCNSKKEASMPSGVQLSVFDRVV